MLCNGLLVIHLVFAIKKKRERKNLFALLVETFLIQEAVHSVQTQTRQLDSLFRHAANYFCKIVIINSKETNTIK